MPPFGVKKGRLQRDTTISVLVFLPQQSITRSLHKEEAQGPFDTKLGKDKLRALEILFFWLFKEGTFYDFSISEAGIHR